MTPSTPDLRSVASDRAGRRVAARWRSLTGGSGVRDDDRRTLVACSGGADSTALALAIAGASRSTVVGHVVHDLRPQSETLAERDRVRHLAHALGVGFVEESVAVRALPGNAEANARRARYDALERVAIQAGCPFVATAHQANDQLETMLMALLRGCGPRGLGGIPPRRRLGPRGVGLVRPMLEITRADAERLCTLGGFGWATDPTNADVSRLRAALRAGPAAALAGLRPGGLGAALAAAENLRDAADLLDSMALRLVQDASVCEGGLVWAREAMRREHAALLAAGLRIAQRRVLEGRHADRLPARALRRAVEAIRDASGERRRFALRACELVVDADTVVLRRTDR